MDGGCLTFLWQTVWVTVISRWTIWDECDTPEWKADLTERSNDGVCERAGVYTRNSFALCWMENSHVQPYIATRIPKPFVDCGMSWRTKWFVNEWNWKHPLAINLIHLSWIRSCAFLIILMRCEMWLFCWWILERRGNLHEWLFCDGLGLGVAFERFFNLQMGYFTQAQFISSEPDQFQLRPPIGSVDTASTQFCQSEPDHLISQTRSPTGPVPQRGHSDQLYHINWTSTAKWHVSAKSHQQTHQTPSKSHLTLE